jgi:hypothetical protein
LAGTYATFACSLHSFVEFLCPVTMIIGNDKQVVKILKAL